MGVSFDGGIVGGILKVADTVNQHRHAVVRDLNSIGYHGDTPIRIDDFASILIASPPGSAVRYAVDGGWPQTDQLLANLLEQDAGLSVLPQRYPRPGIEPETAAPIRADGTANWTPQTIDEFTARRKRLAQRVTEESEKSMVDEGVRRVV